MDGGVLENICCQLTRIANALERLVEQDENSDADVCNKDADLQSFGNMHGSYARFALLLEQRHVRASDVSKATGIATATLTNWKKGRYTPKVDKLMVLADYFGVSVKYFLKDEVEE